MGLARTRFSDYVFDFEYTRLDYAGMDDIGWDVNNGVYAIPFEFSPSFGIFGVAIIFSTKKAWGIWKRQKQ
jgi:hypothetical protein